MILRFSRKDGILSVDGSEDKFVASNEIRNELNGKRRLGEKSEVVRAVVNGQWGPPYMPRPFPHGNFKVLRVEFVDDEKNEFWPVKIVTDATQQVRTWKLDKNGGYLEPTDEYVEDGGYHLHWTKYRTTLGCIKIGTESPDIVRGLGKLIQSKLSMGEEVRLIVEE